MDSSSGTIQETKVRIPNHKFKKWILIRYKEVAKLIGDSIRGLIDGKGFYYDEVRCH